MAPTLKEIAKHCGKSVTTVSHILRDGEHAALYSEATRSKVLAAASELDYLPNFFASQIQQHNRRVIMVAFSNLDDPFAAAIASAIEDTAANRGYYMFSTTLRRNHHGALHTKALGPNGIQALAIVGYTSRSLMSDSELVKYARQGVNVVTVGRPVSDPRISQVGYDNKLALEKCFDHVCAQGARRVWVYGGSDGNKIDLANVRSLRACHIMEYGQKLGVEVHRVESSDGEDACEFLRALLSESQPHAVVCMTDTDALQAIQALTAHGLQVGSDVAVTGCNDEPYAKYITPAMTTVAIPMAQLGRIGANLLLDQIEGREAPGANLVLETKLMIRQSGNLSLK